MRICLVSREVVGVRGGGIGTYVAGAGKALGAEGHEVWLLTAEENRAAAELLAGLQGFHRIVYAGDGVPVEERKHYFHGQPRYAHAMLLHQTLQRLGTSFDYIEFPDFEAEGLVVLQEQRLFGTYGATALAVVLHTPTMDCLRFNRQEHRIDLRTREICNLEDEAIRIAPILISPSHGLRDEVLARLGIERDVRIVRYPMDFDSELVVAPPRPRDRLADLRFVYYGRIEARKGIQELVDAFRLLPDLELTLIGTDLPCSPYGDSLRKFVARRAPANVRFEDALPRAELLTRLRDFDICIFPSIFENWPNACLEAMAMARVVVGSKHGGMSEMIEDGVSGFLVDGRSPTDIARGLREGVGASLARLDAIGTAAAARVRALTAPGAYAQQITDLVGAYQRDCVAVPTLDTEAHKVSVVIPFYNDKATIDAAVDSARTQTHKNLEILVINDGSPLPDAEEVLAKQAAKDARIRVVHKPNGGLSSARNHAIQIAEGEFLLFLDADNEARPDYAKTCVETLVRCPASGFVTPNVRFYYDRSGRELGVYNAMPFDRAISLLTNRVGDAGAFFRRSVFIDHGIRYDELLIAYEDWALWMDLHGLGIAGERVPRVLYDYRVRGRSMVSEDGVPNHGALVGLLIERHLPRVSSEDRALLTSVFQLASDWGVMLGARPLRYKFVDEVSRISRKWPRVNRVLRRSLDHAFRFGRWAGGKRGG